MTTNKVVKASLMAVWLQEDGPFSPWKVFRPGETSVSGRTRPGPGKTPVYTADENGLPVLSFSNIDAPGDSPAMSLAYFDDATVSKIVQRQRDGVPLNVHIRANLRGLIDNPFMWDRITAYVGGLVSDVTPDDGPTAPFDGGEVLETGEVTFDYVLDIVKTQLVSQASGVSLGANDIHLIDASSFGRGADYPGPSKIAFVALDADSGVAADVLYTRNGGSTWAAMSAAPFAADEHIGFIVGYWTDVDTIRLIVGCSTTDGSALAKIAYGDVSLGAEGTITWTEVVSGSSDGATGEVVTALFWDTVTRLYIATDGGDIYISGDFGESWDDDAIYLGANQINAFAASPDGKKRTWAVGATNTILLEVNQSGTFENRVGPSGGADFTAVAEAGDGTLYAGNGTSLYRSTNKAANTGGWTELKDFGTGHAVVGIHLMSRFKDSQHFRVFVDDSTPGAGEVWETLDGGATFRQITELTNTGYNAVAVSRLDDNYALIVGDGGSIHKLAPAQ